MGRTMRTESDLVDVEGLVAEWMVGELDSYKKKSLAEREARAMLENSIDQVAELAEGAQAQL